MQACFEKAYAEHERGRLDRAEDGYRRVLGQYPKYVPALYMLGILCYQRGHYPQAVKQFDAVILLVPDDADAHFERANSLYKLGKLDDALTSIQQAILLDAGNPDFHCNRGLILRDLKRHEEALLSYQQGLALNREDPDLWFNQGNALRSLGREQDALESYLEVLKRDPHHCGALNNAGLALHGLGAFSEALQMFERVIVVNPEALDAYCNAGGYLDSLGQSEKALSYYSRALQICGNKPETRAKRIEALEGYGLVLLSLNRLTEAEKSFRDVIVLRENKAVGRFNLALALLAQGKLEEGWGEYEARHAPGGVQAGRYRRPGTPRWEGKTSPAGKRLLLLQEQGFGDMLQFCRYIPLLKNLGVNVLLETPAVLRRLFGELFPEIEFTVAGDPWPAHDCHIPLMSLPWVFGTRLSDIPDLPPYPSYVPCIAGREGRRRIGLVWSGNPAHHNDRNRSLPLAMLLPMIESIDADWYCLQTEIRQRDEAVLLDSRIMRFPPESMRDFADTAAIVNGLDLVISVDTSVAHLAGLLGKPLCLLLPYAPDWRWLIEGDATPWYPTAKLYRQPALGDWRTVLAQLQADCARSEGGLS